MEDVYVDGKNRAAIDDKITQALKKVKKSELGGMPMLTGIQNENGEIYRVITVEGLGGYIALTEEIAKLGLIDLHKDNLNPEKYDSLFVFK